MKAVVLFGAGASRACTNLKPAPPSGNELFARIERDGTAATLPDDIKEVFKTEGFEKGMEILLDRSPELIPKLNCQIAAYLLGFSKNLHTPYHDLFSIMKGKSNNILWSTLNYDCLIENAMRHILKRYKYLFDDSKSPIRDGIPTIMKLHGSSNFSYNFGDRVHINFYGSTFKMAFRRHHILDSSILPLDEDIALKKWLDPRESVGPAISLYTRGKYNLIAPTLFQKQLSLWSKIILECDAIVIVGVSYVEHDYHIWDPIFQSEAKIGYIDMDHVNTSDKLKSMGRKKVIHLSRTFDRKSCKAIRRFIYG